MCDRVLRRNIVICYLMLTLEVQNVQFSLFLGEKWIIKFRILTLAEVCAVVVHVQFY